MQAMSLGDNSINEGDIRIKIYSIAMCDLIQASNDPSCKQNLLINLNMINYFNILLIFYQALHIPLYKLVS